MGCAPTDDHGYHLMSSYLLMTRFPRFLLSYIWCFGVIHVIITANPTGLLQPLISTATDTIAKYEQLTLT